MGRQIRIVLHHSNTDARTNQRRPSHHLRRHLHILRNQYHVKQSRHTSNRRHLHHDSRGPTFQSFKQHRNRTFLASTQRQRLPLLHHNLRCSEREKPRSPPRFTGHTHLCRNINDDKRLCRDLLAVILNESDIESRSSLHFTAISCFSFRDLGNHPSRVVPRFDDDDHRSPGRRMGYRGGTPRTLSHQPNRMPEGPTQPLPWAKCGAFCASQKKILDIVLRML